MSVVSIAEAWPAPGKPFTVAELDQMPDDGRRYELLNGGLAVSPRPGNPHQLVAFTLATTLDRVCPPQYQVLPEPAVQISDETELAPDVVVIRQEQVNEAKCTVPPLLVVEVRSPRTALIDLNLKKAAYERFGVESYWVVVPDRDEPEVIVFELRDGRYKDVAHVVGDEVFAAEKPFPVEVIPARLVAGLRAR
jgi:Uma2 family endonuclease